MISTESCPLEPQIIKVTVCLNRMLRCCVNNVLCFTLIVSCSAGCAVAKPDQTCQLDRVVYDNGHGYLFAATRISHVVGPKVPGMSARPTTDYVLGSVGTTGAAAAHSDAKTVGMVVAEFNVIAGSPCCTWTSYRPSASHKIDWQIHGKVASRKLSEIESIDEVSEGPLAGLGELKPSDCESDEPEG